jgi:GC-rich sequence DNA-binding factor
MVATMFCPRLCAFIENGALNPYSTKQTRRLVEICEEVEVYVPRDDIKYKVRYNMMDLMDYYIAKTS